MSGYPLSTSLALLPEIGPKRAQVLAQELGLQTFGDLLHYYPYKYIDRSRIYTVRELTGDATYVQLRGYIRDFRLEGSGRKLRLSATFVDKTGALELLWFHKAQTIERLYQLGREYIIFGKPSIYKGRFSIVHPEIDTIEKLEGIAGGLSPLYSLSEKLKRSGITNRMMRTLIQRLFTQLDYRELYESLPPALFAQSQLMHYSEALRQIHFPSSTAYLEEARRRLKVEELLLIQLRLQHLRLVRRASYQGILFETIGSYFNELYTKHLPFDLTGAQKRVLREIRADVGSGLQMNRLVQGDVGSGKTLVALFAMLMAVDNGYQACLMAPTEILARQHQANLQELLTPLGLKVTLLVGSTAKRERRQILPALADGSLRILVGTHALLEENVQFANLALAVIDEQHRFGVAQRSRLWNKTSTLLPHILIMTATPIPRTLAMTLYGDLDISIIDELPPGRKPITTYHHPEERMYEVYDFLRKEILLGHQAYVVFPMIEERETEDLRDLESGLERYRAAFPEYRIAYVHGKMKSKEKDEHMQEFVAGRAHILLATTVIEVGVNVPNASVMIIEGANRFGLSQLHQLRGRVGRGAEQSYCILVTNQGIGLEARRRIDIMCETSDGFVIAEEDMRLRGFGELDGTRQSGRELTLKITNPARDGALIQYCRQIAETILESDPQLELPEHTPLKRRLQESAYSVTNWGAIS